MTTKRYLRNTAYSLPSSTLPSGEQDSASASFTAAGANTLREALSVPGSLMMSLDADTTATVSNQAGFLGFWALEPLSADQTVGGGAETLTVNVADSQSNLESNFCVNRAHAYIWRPSTNTLVGNLCSYADAPSSGSPTEATAINDPQVTTFTLVLASVAALTGDVIIVELWSNITQDSATSYSAKLYFDGTTNTTVENTSVDNHASYIEFSQTLSLASNVAHTTVNAVEPQGDTVSSGTMDVTVSMTVSGMEVGGDTASASIAVETPPVVVEVCPVEPYLDLITMEHKDKLNFVSMVAMTCQPFADIRCIIKTYAEKYNVDTAIGAQLDVVGKWVGVDRFLSAPINNVFFSFDTVDLGFDQGVWFGPYDDVSGLVKLPDEFYRLIIKVRILNNRWDGTKQQAYDTMQAIFSQFGYTLFIEDHSDLTISIGLIGSGPPTPLISGLLAQGKFDIKPAGIRIKQYVYQSAPGPIFSFDLNTPLFTGFDISGWGTLTSP